MHAINTCLGEAMFAASSSYSSSRTSFSQLMDKMCDEAVVLINEGEWASISALAA